MDIKGQYISDTTVAKYTDKWEVDYLTKREYRVNCTKELLKEGWTLERIYIGEFESSWSSRMEYFFADLFKDDYQIKGDKDVMRQISDIHGTKDNIRFLG